MRCAADLGPSHLPSPPCPRQEGRAGHGAGCPGVGLVPSGWQGKRSRGARLQGCTVSGTWQGKLIPSPALILRQIPGDKGNHL